MSRLSSSLHSRIYFGQRDDEVTRMQNGIGLVLLYTGAVALFVGYIGIVFCGFAIGFWRGIRNLILPFVAFGDAYNRFPQLLWVWGGGIAFIALGALLTH
ncbi:MAG: hypothetical protein DME97_02420 [Verrucomicrobia bacterium]|nr:MAG: hypothetical protein DME97_02420 [Verrucomicrobiota bacterium]